MLVLALLALLGLTSAQSSPSLLTSATTSRPVYTATGSQSIFLGTPSDTAIGVSTSASNTNTARAPSYTGTIVYVSCSSQGTTCINVSRTVPPAPTNAPPTPIPNTGTVLESFEGDPAAWRVLIDQPSGSVVRSGDYAADGRSSARISAAGHNGRAFVSTAFKEAATDHQWEERPGTWRWQRARVFLPSQTIAQLDGDELARLEGGLGPGIFAGEAGV